uniref:Polygalacturonase n=1 Tax=Kalanchoe fedtschenkoi TaxID=63787 RepID=A0A7N0ZXM8_KALFE
TTVLHRVWLAIQKKPIYCYCNILIVFPSNINWRLFCFAHVVTVGLAVTVPTSPRSSMDIASDHHKPPFLSLLSTTLFAARPPPWCLLLPLFTVVALCTANRSSFTFPFLPLPQTHDGLHSVTYETLLNRNSCAVFFSGVGAVRRTVVSIADFGGVGDGVTSNTAAFHKAIRYLEERGGGSTQLNVPRGRWLTGSFNLTSNFTLFLEHGAVILGSQDPNEWPIIEPLPSYGRGRERLGGRHISLIHGDGLTNVIITGQNGTVDGQGKMWWDLWWNRTLEHTRGHLIELMNSRNILISNLTFMNSPFWTVHPVYCSNVVIKEMTILAPLNAPNTDGIDPGYSPLLFKAK